MHNLMSSIGGPLFEKCMYMCAHMIKGSISENLFADMYVCPDVYGTRRAIDSSVLES